MSKRVVLEIKDLYYSYRGSRDYALKKINMSVSEGEIVSLLGPNGSGKTTLLKIIARILDNYSGQVKLFDKNLREYDPREYSRLVSYVPQIENISTPYTVFEYVLIGRSPYINLIKVSDRDIKKSLEAIHLVGIEDLINRRINELSGGEAQLARIARALAQEPKIILLDEPTSHLDLGNKVKILRLIRSLSKNGFTIIFTTHDPNEALSVSNKVYVLNKGSVIAKGDPVEILSKELIERLYSVNTIMFKNDRFVLLYPEI
ncbi:MAG: ABC transporter ATP-binding protein [Sulfolobales archaeon]